MSDQSTPAPQPVPVEVQQSAPVPVTVVSGPSVQQFDALSSRVDDHEAVIKSIGDHLEALVARLDKWQRIAIAIATGVLLSGGGDVAKQIVSAVAGH